uniref:Uncharacterized protein n=1 Tax=Knipowitschia caucasica TaxID=637954 RepID=A0AAV2KDK3_KNICA
MSAVSQLMYEADSCRPLCSAWICLTQQINPQTGACVQRKITKPCLDIGLELRVLYQPQSSIMNSLL